MTATGTVSVAVPDIGDFEDVPIIEILVSPGDTVALEDPLVTLESDKATMDVPAPVAGVVKEIVVKVGDRVSQGTPLLTLAEQDGAAPAATRTAASPADAAAPPEQRAAAPEQRAGAPEQRAGAAEQPTAAAEQPAGAAEQPTAAAEQPAGAAEQPAGATEQPAGAAEQPAGAAEQPAGAAEQRAGATEQPVGQRAAPPEAPPAPEAVAAEPPPAHRDDGAIYASPSARRLARELGVELRRVAGSGRGGRITREDVHQAASRGTRPADGGRPAPAIAGLDLPPWPSVDFEKFGPVERVERSRIQRISAPNLARNWIMIPHVTHNDEADITELEAWRKQLNAEQLVDAGAVRSSEVGGRAGGTPAQVKVTMVSFLVLGCVAALKAFPTFNSSLDGEQLVLKRYYNIGFAADTPGGLVVPVIKGADSKGLLEIAGELTALSSRAREGKLSPADMSGSTFTISSLGGIGGTSFTPIVNAPEVAILGVTRSATKPVWNGSEFVPRLMLPLSLSYDHRVIDGAAAARFVAYLARVLSDLRRALL
jgi:pyruvate dehydrogenase E2 component (dihydrolipoamide acetyltransferase)